MTPPDNFFSCDYFALFGFSPTTEIDGDKLRAQYQKLQAMAHPDKFAAAAESEKRAALQMASRINDGYAVLQNPLLRAAYILELQGVRAFAEDNTAMPPEFLMRQMEWREQLEELQESDFAERDSLLAEIAAARDETRAKTAALLQNQDWQAATDAVRQWKYLEKILSESDSSPR